MSSTIKRAQAKAKKRQAEITKHFQTIVRDHCNCCNQIYFKGLVQHLMTTHQCKPCEKKGIGKCPYPKIVAGMLSVDARMQTDTNVREQAAEKWL